MPNQAQLKRYDHTSTFGRSESRMNLEPYGDYVKYSDIEPLIEALRFYADEESWKSDGGLDFHQHVREKIKKDSWYPNDDEHHPYSEVRGGKTARQALQKAGL